MATIHATKPYFCKTGIPLCCRTCVCHCITFAISCMHIIRYILINWCRKVRKIVQFTKLFSGYFLTFPYSQIFFAAKDFCYTVASYVIFIILLLVSLLSVAVIIPYTLFKFKSPSIYKNSKQNFY